MSDRGPGDRAEPRTEPSRADAPARVERSSEAARAERSTEIMKGLRQRAIRDLVEQRPIRTQQELAAALRERGFRATQATISRDVAELGLVKVTREGVSVYALPARLRGAGASGEERLRRLLHDLPVEIRESGLLLVIKTLPGSPDRGRHRSGPLAGGRRLPRRRRHALRRRHRSGCPPEGQAPPRPPRRVAESDDACPRVVRSESLAPIRASVAAPCLSNTNARVSITRTPLIARRCCSASTKARALAPGVHRLRSVWCSQHTPLAQPTGPPGPNPVPDHAPRPRPGAPGKRLTPGARLATMSRRSDFRPRSSASAGLEFFPYPDGDGPGRPTAVPQEATKSPAPS